MSHLREKLKDILYTDPSNHSKYIMPDELSIYPSNTYHSRYSMPYSKEYNTEYSSLYKSKSKIKKGILDDANFRKISYPQNNSHKNNKTLSQIQIVSNYLNKPKELCRSPARPVANLTRPELQINHRDYLRKSPTNIKNFDIKLRYSYDFQKRTIPNSYANIDDLKYFIERQKVKEKFELEKFDEGINLSNRSTYFNLLKKSGW